MPAFHFPAFRIQKLYPLEVSYTTKKNPVPVGFSTNIILCYILCRLARAAPELRSVAAGELLLDSSVRRAAPELRSVAAGKLLLDSSVRRAAPELRSVAAGIRPMGFFGGNSVRKRTDCPRRIPHGSLLTSVPHEFHGIYFHAGAHGGGQGDAPQILALQGAGFCLYNCIH